MFGENPIRKAEHDIALGYDGQVLWVQEVFPTIQGEGPYAGQPAVFVRLAGCNLRCFFCDTDFESSDWYPTLPELFEAIVKANEQVNTDLVVLTGGEPLRQNITPLCERLIQAGYDVQIETAGTVCPPGLTDLIESCNRPTIVVSPKTPVINEDIWHHAVAWKYIIRDGDADPVDGLPNRSTQHRNRISPLARPPEHMARSSIYVQPCDEIGQEANMRAAAQIAMKYGYTLSIQTHKVVGVP